MILNVFDEALVFKIEQFQNVLLEHLGLDAVVVQSNIAFDFFA